MNCNGVGIFRRTGVFGLLEATQQIRDLIRERAGAGIIVSTGQEQGMTTIRDDGLRLLLNGSISPEEFRRVVDDA